MGSTEPDWQMPCKVVYALNIHAGSHGQKSMPPRYALVSFICCKPHTATCTFQQTRLAHHAARTRLHLQPLDAIIGTPHSTACANIPLPAHLRRLARAAAALRQQPPCPPVVHVHGVRVVHRHRGQPRPIWAEAQRADAAHAFGQRQPRELASRGARPGARIPEADDGAVRVRGDLSGRKNTVRRVARAGDGDVCGAGSQGLDVVIMA